MAFLLVVTVLLPFVGSLLLACLPHRPSGEARSVALGFALGTLGLTLVLLLGFRSGVVGPQFAYGGGRAPFGVAWLNLDPTGQGEGIRFALGLDGISLALFGLTAVLGVAAVACSWDAVERRAHTHYALLLALLGGLLGLFASLDVILFYVCFEFTLIPLFFLIGIYGGRERRRASLTFFLYTLAGSLLTLVGVLALVAIHAQYAPGHEVTFSIPKLTAGLARIPWAEWQAPHAWTESGLLATPQVAVFLLLFAGFAAKLAFWPFHSWQPLSYSECPTGPLILLAGATSKIGTYGLLRFNLGMTPLAAEALAPLMTTLATFAILYGALAALAQHDLKRLLAYSSISHMGFIVLGLFALNATGIEGATIQMVNHGLTTGALFACVGLVTDHYRTRDMGELGGLWNRYPLWAGLILVAALGSVALPGLNGFVGEFPILAGSYATHPRTTAWATLGMVLGAYYLFWMLQRLVFGPLSEPTVYQEADASALPVGRSVIGGVGLGGVVPLVVLIVLIGLVPAPFIDRIKPPLAPIVARLQPATRGPIAQAVPTEAVARRQPSLTPEGPTDRLVRHQATNQP